MVVVVARQHRIGGKKPHLTYVVNGWKLTTIVKNAPTEQSEKGNL